MVKAILASNISDKRDLIRTGSTMMSEVSRSIFNDNINTLFKDCKDMRIMYVTLKAPVFAFKNTKQIVIKNMQSLANKVASSGIMIGIKVAVHTTCTMSFNQVLDNTTSLNGDVDEQWECNCNKFTNINKCEGHVLQPLL